mmetsp:Transcript_24635/g.39085  ORF Transcript_24635/g.39085 Transcript_24635/m.39085 type:complete len:228 (-) Transcript_24635:1639-2322(-)
MAIRYRNVIAQLCTSQLASLCSGMVRVEHLSVLRERVEILSNLALGSIVSLSYDRHLRLELLQAEESCCLLVIKAMAITASLVQELFQRGCLRCECGIKLWSVTGQVSASVTLQVLGTSWNDSSFHHLHHDRCLNGEDICIGLQERSLASLHLGLAQDLVLAEEFHILGICELIHSLDADLQIFQAAAGCLHLPLLGIAITIEDSWEGIFQDQGDSIARALATFNQI